MSTFTPNELTYLSEQRIGRLATVDRKRPAPRRPDRVQHRWREGRCGDRRAHPP